MSCADIRHIRERRLRYEDSTKRERGGLTHMHMQHVHAQHVHVHVHVHVVCACVHVHVHVHVHVSGEDSGRLASFV